MCSHTKALLLTLNKSSSWCSPRYHIDTYVQCYSANIRSMVLSGKLIADRNYVPPDYKKPAGRPTKKRKERSWVRSSSVSRICTACGQSGHMYTTCDAPSTQYRYKKHVSKAMKWCETQERTQLAGW
jgi:hypothetical protein